MFRKQKAPLLSDYVLSLGSFAILGREEIFVFSKLISFLSFLPKEKQH